MRERAYIVFLACLLLAAICNSRADDKAWLEHAARNDCQRLGNHAARYQGTIWRPAGEVWRCHDGRIYWR